LTFSSKKKDTNGDKNIFASLEFFKFSSSLLLEYRRKSKLALEYNLSEILSVNCKFIRNLTKLKLEYLKFGFIGRILKPNLS